MYGHCQIERDLKDFITAKVKCFYFSVEKTRETESGKIHFWLNISI